MVNYQRVTAEIDLEAVAFNIQNIRKMTPAAVDIMGVVKADAYGHGAVQVSRVLLENGVSYLAVAVLEEAIALRKNGIDSPILILGYTPEDNFSAVIENHTIQTIFSLSQAKKFSQAAQLLGKTGQIHIKIDTGMSRLGFLPNEKTVEEILEIFELPHIEIDGIFTHFSSADEVDKSFTMAQKDCFSNMLSALDQKGLTFKHIHASNSASIIDMDDCCFNMIRPGIILYGYYPSNEVRKERLPLRPVMRLKTHISFIKEVEAQTPIGYGKTYFTKRKSKVATIPVGYADGYFRKMTKGGRVMIRGQYAPVIGRICMDQFMVDVTDLPQVSLEDEVILMGKQGEAEITADEIAGILETINYEVVCGISKRVPRLYIKNNQTLETVSYILSEF